MLPKQIPSIPAPLRHKKKVKGYEIIGIGAGASRKRYVVYKVEHTARGYVYHMVDTETKEISQTDILRPLSQTFGIGRYYDDVNPEFMDAFEVALLVGQAEEQATAQAIAAAKEKAEHDRIAEIGAQRLRRIMPEGVQGVIDRLAYIAGNEENICLPEPKDEKRAERTETSVQGGFIIVDYSEKAIAVFGDTKPVKDALHALGGRFNARLTHDGQKKAGWIFQKTKEDEVRRLLGKDE